MTDTSYLVDPALALIHLATAPDSWQPRCGAAPPLNRSFYKPFPGIIPPGHFCQHCLSASKVTEYHLITRNNHQQSA